jgi:short-subunit dehydrogenase involved in D-alanine esterification of teichoic acids
MNISFENKVAPVTGAGSGLGLATAKAVAESGASVALADWNEQAVRSAAEELAAQGHKALAIGCDVADDAQVEAMVEQTVATFGRLDAACNNGGVQNIVAEAADGGNAKAGLVFSVQGPTAVQLELLNRIVIHRSPYPVKSCRGFLVSSRMDPTFLSILLSDERSKASERDPSCHSPKFSERLLPKSGPRE